MIYDGIITAWEGRRRAYAQAAALVDGCKLIDAFLADLQTLAQNEGERILNLKEAAKLSGYSEEHLGRLLRHGRIPNAGGKGRPRIRIQDLPRRVQRVAKSYQDPYSVETDARNLLSRRGERHHDESNSKAQ